MKKLLLFFAVLLPLIGFSQGNLDMKFRKLTADSLWLKKKPAWATTDTSAYKVLYRNATTGKIYEKGLSVSDTGKVNTTGTEIKYGSMTFTDSVYNSKLSINSLVGTTGTGALKSIAYGSDSLYLRNDGDNSYSGNYYFGGNMNLGGSMFLSKFAVVGKNTTNVNMFNFVNGDYNINRSTLSQARDTSSFNFSFTPIGKPLLNLTSESGSNILTIDSLKRFGFNTAPPSNADANILVYKASTDNFVSTNLSGNEFWTNINSYFSAGNYRTFITGASSSFRLTQTGFYQYNAASVVAGNTNSRIAKFILEGGKISIGGAATVSTTASPTFTISMNGTVAQTMGVEPAASGVAGANFNFYGSNAGGVTDVSLNGGMSTFGPGASRGAGLSSLRLTRNARLTTTSTINNTLSDAIIIPSEFNLSDNVQASLFEVALANDEGAGGGIEFTITATDGDTTQVYSGYVVYSIANGNGVCSELITESVANTIDIPAATTDMTTAWAITSTCGTKATIQVTANTGFTPTGMKIRYKIHNGSVNAITQL